MSFTCPMQDCLVICDRGTMDASAFVSQEQWGDILRRVDKDEFDICEARYDHVVHMVRVGWSCYVKTSIFYIQ